VPPLPTASTEIIRLITDPDVSNAEISKAIEYDPSLTANVLRLANSAFFGFVQEISTVKDALFRLGTNRIFQVVLSTAVGKMAQRSSKGYDVSGADLWDHLIGTAISSMKIAKVLGQTPPDHTFTAALMHDVGKIVLGTFDDVDASLIVNYAIENRIPLEKAEAHILGIDHSELGARLLEFWRLPQYLSEVARWHHEPAAIEEGNNLVVNIVHVADVTCLMAGVGASTDALAYRPQDSVMSSLGLRMNMLDTFVYEILNELIEVRNLFKF